MESPAKDKGKEKCGGSTKVVVIKAIEPSGSKLGHWWNQNREGAHLVSSKMTIAPSELPEGERLLLPQVPRMQLTKQENITKEDLLQLAIVALNSLGHQI